MPQGFLSNRHKVARDEQSRWAFYKHTLEEDPLPDDPDVLPLVIKALSGRIRRMDRSKGRAVPSAAILGEPRNVDQMRQAVSALLNRIQQLDRTRNKDLAKRIEICLGVIAQRCRWPGELEATWFKSRLGHYDLLFEHELNYLEHERLTAFTCIPAVLRLQRDMLYEFMAGSRSRYTKNDTPATWLQRHQRELYEVLTFNRCVCTYRPPDLDQIDARLKGPGELIPAILAGLHAGSAASSIRQILKQSARPSKVPSFLR